MNIIWMVRPIPATALAAVLITIAAMSVPEANAQDRILTEYTSIGARFIRDCKDLDQANPPQGDRLKHCLTISRELYEKLSSFNKRIEDLVRLIKNGGKWNPQLDQQFYSDASRLGIDQALLTDVRAAGGLRSFIERSVSDLKNLKAPLAAEIAQLDAEVRNLGGRGSTANASNRAIVIRIIIKVIYIAQTGSLSMNAACALSGLCAR